MTIYKSDLVDRGKMENNRNEQYISLYDPTSFLNKNQILTKTQRIIIFNILLANNKKDLINFLLNTNNKMVTSYFHGLPFFVEMQWNNINKLNQPDSSFNLIRTETEFKTIQRRFIEREKILLKSEDFLDMDDEDIKLFHFLWDLNIGGKKILSNELISIGKDSYGLTLKNIEYQLRVFSKKGFIKSIENSNEYQITNDCFILMINSLIEYPIWRYVYNNLNRSALKSTIYREYCRKTYLVDLCQLGQVTKKQIDKLIEICDGGRDFKVLEIGSGTGHISEYIYDKTASEYYSSDISDFAINEAVKRNQGKRDRLFFERGNIYKINYKVGSFDAIIAVDSLQYLIGLDDVLIKLKTLLKSGGILYTFWESWIKNEENILMKNPEYTKLGKVLTELNLEYETWDFSEDNKKAWNRTVKNLNLYKDDFVNDDAQVIYKSRIDETSRVDNCIESSRFLYKIKLG